MSFPLVAFLSCFIVMYTLLFCTVSIVTAVIVKYLTGVDTLIQCYVCNQYSCHYCVIVMSVSVIVISNITFIVIVMIAVFSIVTITTVVTINITIVIDISTTTGAVILIGVVIVGIVAVITATPAGEPLCRR